MRRGLRFWPQGKGLAKVLGDREARIIGFLWQHAPATVSQVHEELNRNHGVAYTTVMTIMSRMAEKGLLVRERSGNAYLYSPAMSEEDFRRQVARSVVDGLVEEFAEPALSYFVERLSLQDEKVLEELVRLTQEKKKKSPGA